MSTELIIKHCSPTLAGLKIGNLFSCNYNDYNELNNTMGFFNGLLNCKGVYLVVLRCAGGRALIYVYRKNRVESILKDVKVQNFLALYGYSDFSLEACLDLLGEHLDNKEFPHEIGVFLSYPLPDILAFIENKGKNYLAVGCWKVYTDTEKAEKTFARYKKCTEVYQKKLSQEFDIARLTVVG